MENEKNKKKTILQRLTQVFGTILIFLMLCSICLLIYFKTFGKEFVPNAITSTYVSTVTNPQNGEELTFMEVNYYEYKNKSNTDLENYAKGGLEVVELRINSYSGTDRQAIYSRGYQLIKIYDMGISSDLMWAYDSYNGDSFLSGHEYDINSVDDSMYIAEINDEMYGVALAGTYIKNEFNLGKSIWYGVSGIFTGWGNKEERTTTQFTYNYSMGDFLNFLAKMVKSSSKGTGDSIIPLADLGSYLSVYAENNNGNFTVPLSFNTLNNAYFTIQAHYDIRPMKSARQSLFKSVMGDSSYNLTEVTSETDYSKDTTIIIADETYFTKRIVDEKTYASLDLNFVKEYLELKNVELEIVFNADEFDGFDYYALCGLKINSLKLTSTNLKDFEILNGALKDTGITLNDIELKNINLIDKGV